MIDPVAWRVDIGEHGWYLFDNLEDAHKYCGDDEPEPLYTADEIERNREAIAELVGALRPFADSRFVLEDWQRASDVIAKYDNTTEKRK